MIQLRRLLRRFDLVENRDRMVVSAAGAGLLLLVWLLLVKNTVGAHQQLTQQRIHMEQTVDAMQHQQASLEKERSALLQPALHRQQQQLQAQIEQLKQQLAQKQTDQQQSGALQQSQVENLVNYTEGLNLLRLQRINEQGWSAEERDQLEQMTERVEGVSGFEIAFEASFQEAYEFLQRVEAVSGQVLWKKLDYVVGVYPHAQIEARLFLIQP
ncbi:MAG: hypothetical protein HOL04_11105 [Gammaproteobacteria bacterium]|nr:hypothetical protein [Gammaproteobacteria bacterium]MBT4607727.1 hypothetical protein [Thiotrichales bacterium]MBT3472911.1 hypothetical protein [Gammaproteobacteria bacterium]MBT3966571.1 hypothetical protein [Gammaproteobacteria bacterium]MBT4081729.1 hypothetical protein [Gammaproteobacteria bacterium]